MGLGFHLWHVALAAGLLTSCTPKSQNVTWRDDLVRAIRSNNVEAVARIVSNNSISADATLNNNLVTPLMVACRAGSADVARWLLDHGATVDAATKNEDGTALLGASDRGFLDVVKLLVERGANVNRQDSRGWTPLRAAIDQDHTAVAEYLISRGADINDASVGAKRSILMVASEKGNTPLVRLLLEKGASVNHIGEDGDHALLDAAAAGRAEVVALLVRSNAAINLQDSEGWTALSEAAALGHCEVVKVLCEAGADPMVRNKFGRTALAYARGITGTNRISKVGDVTAATEKSLFSREEAYYVMARHGSGRDYDCIVKVLEAYEKKFSADSLRQSAPFPIGVGISDQIANRPQDWVLLKRQFNSITPENCMKPASIQPQPGAWKWDLADAFVNFALTNDLKIVGHCLVWAKDDRTPSWFCDDAGQPASRDVLLARMKAHIQTVVGRYRGKIAMWDVVNEALDDGTNYLRTSCWSRTCDEEFIVEAFKTAAAADPNALLIYNDYNNEKPGKFEKMVRLIKTLRAHDASVHAIGLQGHYELDSVPFDALEKTLGILKDLNMKVVVSELDIDVIPRARWWANGGAEREALSKVNPYRDGCPPEILERQAEQYARLFAIFKRHSDQILRVTFWNLHDGQSWLNTFPWKRENYPLLFDRQGKPKPAYEAVLNELRR